MKTQVRGICQVCGCEQAVRKNGLAHHGYTKEWGFFHGTCLGAGHSPMQKSTELTKQVIQDLQSEIVKNNEKAEMLELGSLVPEFKVVQVRVGRDGWKTIYEDKKIPWSELSDYEQKKLVKSLIYNHNFVVRQCEAHIQTLTRLMEQYEGKELLEIVKEVKEVRQICVGDIVKTESGRVLKCVGFLPNMPTRLYYAQIVDGVVGRTQMTTKASWKKHEIVKEV